MVYFGPGVEKMDIFIVLPVGDFLLEFQNTKKKLFFIKNIVFF